ncbi:MAG: hypothetical protein E7632_02510 [Ruminococcaceae bacterium]|nr:hypothetical protein [Oscillospiraceae bacterium]
MKKMIQKHYKLISLVMTLTMLFCTMFAIPASAHDHDHIHEGEACFIVHLPDGQTVRVASLRQVVTCGCSNPVLGDYGINKPHANKVAYHTTPLIQVCFNCGWEYYYGAENIGGCGPWCLYPQWPGWENV